MTIEELFGTLQQSVVGTWRKHLRTSKYSKHMALDEFYTEMPEKVDALIEAWMGVNGRKPKQFDNILKSKNMNTLDYLKSLKKVVKDGYELMDGEKELEALLDDIAELIDSTLYKVKELNENKTMADLKEFLNKSLVNEALFDDDEFEEIDMRLEELYLERSKIYPANKVPYKDGSDVMDYLMENTGEVIEKPFDSVAKKVLKAFGIDPKNVEVFRHIAMDDRDYAEMIVYTPAGEDPEGEDEEYAVQDIYPDYSA
jgi:DNA-binding ferritin-like protein